MAGAIATDAGGARQVLQVLVPAVQHKISEFDAQGLANTAWAFAALAWRDGPIVGALAAAVVSLIDREVMFEGQGLANLFWSFAKLSVRDAPLLTALSGVVVRRI